MATKKSAAKKSTAKKAKAKRSSPPPSKRWSAKVTTDSTKPTPGIFNKSARAIADDLAKPGVSPKGPGQGMQMLSFYENRAGKNLSAERKKTLEAAKDILREKEGKPPAKKSSTKKKASS
jgi:tRNA(adenine34) deaminase